MSYCYLWRAQGAACRFLADCYFRELSIGRPIIKWTLLISVGSGMELNLHVLLCFVKTKQQKNKQSPTELLGLFTTFPRNLAAKHNTGINSKCLGVVYLFWVFFTADQFFQFCYELLLKWQGKLGFHLVLCDKRLTWSRVGNMAGQHWRDPVLKGFRSGVGDCTC